MDINQTYELKNCSRHYNYFKCIHYLQKQGRILYGNNYRIHPSQRQQVYRLLVYATAKKEECVLYAIDQQKGLLITGPENSGKTSLMHLLKPFFKANRQYIIRSSMEVAASYNIFGETTLEKYQSKNTDYCFDDLGLEPVVGYTSGNREIVGELIQLRLENSATTHIITRMNADALHKRYGNHFCNLLYQNFNVVALTRSFNL